MSDHSDDKTQEDERWWKTLYLASVSFALGVAVAIFMITVWPGVHIHHENTVTAWEMFSFAGILVTVIAFLSAFFILFMAIDAFAVSRAIDRNRKSVGQNSKMIRTHTDQITEIKTKFAGLSNELEKSGLILTVNRMFVLEKAALYETIEDLKSRVNVVAREQGVLDEVKEISSSYVEDDGARMARMSVLTALAENMKGLTELEEKNLESAQLELADSILYAENLRDAQIAEILHRSGLRQMSDEVMEKVQELLGTESS